MYKKKSLGQHFLHSHHYVQLIATAGAVAKGDVVLEIGPGEGVLTQELLTRGARVIAIEKDRRLLPVLREMFPEALRTKQLQLIEGDALHVSPSQLHLPKKYKVVANIPYYISGALIEKFLTTEKQPTSIVFLLQKEVAYRIAREKKESILSLSVKVYGTPRVVSTVPRGAFTPPPNVDSAILQITNISRKQFRNKKHEERFFALLHAGFGKKRKLLKRNVEPVLHEHVGPAFNRAHITDSARAEEIRLDQWLQLAQ